MNFIAKLIFIFQFSTVATVSNAEFISVATSSFDCMTEAIYFEARNQSKAGQIAVANVILNRVSHPSHPNTVCEVVHEHKQFSYYFDGLPEVVDDLRAWRLAANITAFVMYEQVFDITEGSTIYHADYVTPNWDWTKLSKVVTIDNHLFYVEK